MAIIYYKKIKSGEITIDDVPERWRKEVYALLFQKIMIPIWRKNKNVDI